MKNYPVLENVHCRGILGTSWSAAMIFWSDIFAENFLIFCGKFLSSFCQNCVLQRLKFTTTMSRIALLLNLSMVCRSFMHDLHRKFLFFDFAARKRNIFSRPGIIKDKVVWFLFSHCLIFCNKCQQTVKDDTFFWGGGGRDPLCVKM